MKRSFFAVLMLAGCLAGRCLAQAPATAQAPAGAGDGQSKPAGGATKPGESNPFPEDVSTVPVLGSKATDLPEDASAARTPLPGDDSDPVKSPDEGAAAVPAAGGNSSQESSSSFAGMDDLLPKPGDDEKPGRHGKMTAPPEAPKETAKSDLDVGKYYLDQKNWKAALSRLQSAMVLNPEDPEVFWALAEAERHLGDFWAAKAHYEKVAEFDPDSKHGNEARKALKEPEIENAKGGTGPGK